MKLKYLEYFLTVAELGNITHAAQRLYLSQPNLTVAMKRLEEELGVTLGVVVACITDVMLLQIVLYLLLAIHSSVYGFIRLCVYGFIAHSIRVLPMPL